MTAVLVGIMGLFHTAHAKDWADARGSCYHKGSMNLTAGVTLADFGVFGTFDYGVHDAISVGLAMAYTSYSEDYSYGGELKYSEIPITLRAAFHPFNLSALKDSVPMRDKLDVYVGLGAGYRSQSISGGGSSVSAGGEMLFEIYVGTRYYFTEKLYASAELGSGMALLNCGVGYKF